MDATPQQPRGLACIECGGRLKVLRTDNGDRFILRRRECVDCGERFTTKERFANRSDDAPADMVGVAAFSIAAILQQQGLLAERPSCDPPNPTDSQ